MPADARDRAMRVADLIDRPGASRRVHVALPPAHDLHLDMATLLGSVHLDGVIESVVEGLLVRGAVSGEMVMACARCLADLQQHVAADVVELFSDPADAESPEDVEAGYEITDGTIDLDMMIRDALVPAVPYRPLCRAECRGLCAQCGINRNDAECACVDENTDARWAALEGLQLTDGETN
jgi:uncharacterized protein